MLYRLKKLFFLDFKLLLKNKTFYLRLILFPIALIFILSMIFNSSSTTILKPFTISFLCEDEGVVIGHQEISLGEILQNKVFGNSKSIVKLKKVSSYKEGKEQVEQNKTSCFVYVPKYFTKKYLNSQECDLSLLKGKNDSVHNEVVSQILKEYTDELNGSMAEKTAAMKAANDGNLRITPKVIETLQRMQVNIQIPTETSNKSSKPISALQYYSIGMVVMFALLTGITIIHNVIDEKENYTFYRIKTLPIRGIEYSFGKLFGIMIAIILQMAIVILISSIIFGMRWGNLFDIFLVTIVYGFVIGSFVLLAGLLAKNQTTMSGISTPIFLILSFLGGSMMQKSGFPDGLSMIQQITPNGSALNAYILVCQGGNLSQITIQLAYLLGLGILFLIPAIIIYNHKGVQHSC